MELCAEFKIERFGSRYIKSNAAGFGDQLGMVSIELRNLETRLTFDKARRDKDERDWWGNAVYVRGEGDLVHLASSLHHLDVQQNFVTITSRQLDAVLKTSTASSKPDHLLAVST